jgi:CRISPR system Cascade subunit CasE
LGLLRSPEQEIWLIKKSQRHGFSVSVASGSSSGPLNLRISGEEMLRARQHGGNGIRVFSVLYDGVLAVTDPVAFIACLRSGIGHGKALGLGLLSVAPDRTSRDGASA